MISPDDDERPHGPNMIIGPKYYRTFVTKNVWLVIFAMIVILIGCIIHIQNNLDTTDVHLTAHVIMIENLRSEIHQLVNDVSSHIERIDRELGESKNKLAHGLKHHNEIYRLFKQMADNNIIVMKTSTNEILRLNELTNLVTEHNDYIVSKLDRDRTSGQNDVLIKNLRIKSQRLSNSILDTNRDNQKQNACQ